MSNRPKKITFNWAHLISTNTGGGQPLFGMMDLVGWMGLTWGNDTTGGGGETYEPLWTTFSQGGTDIIVYVSDSDGDDTYTGLNQTHTTGLTGPKKTIAAGMALLRARQLGGTHYADWLLLKCGDTWTYGVGEAGLGDFNGLSGRSINQYMLVGSYGTGARPLIRTGTSGCVTLSNNYDRPADYVAFVGLEMYAHTYDGTSGNPVGVYWLSHSDGLLIEDCYIHNYGVQNVCIQGYYAGTGDRKHTNVTLRGNIIADCYHFNGEITYSTGLFISSSIGILCEWNVIDRNGWNDTYTGSEFCHNVYIANGNTGTIEFKNNIVAGTDGVEFRSGGMFSDNLMLKNAVAINFGLGSDPEPAGVSGSVLRNVVLDGGNITDVNPNKRGWPLRIANVSSATVSDNIFANNVNGGNPRAMSIEGNPSFDYTTGIGCHNITFSDNIVYNWSSSVYVYALKAYMVGCTFSDNVVQEPSATPSNRLVYMVESGAYSGFVSSGNQFYCPNLNSATNYMKAVGSDESLATWKTSVGDSTSTESQVSYPNPDRDIASYMTSLGGTASFDGFMTQARLQSRQSWSSNYTAAAVADYIREGFGL